MAVKKYFSKKISNTFLLTEKLICWQIFLVGQCEQ